MIKNYFTTALRHLLKNRGTAIINITGLALGITSLLIILVMVRYELSYNDFHSTGYQLYRVVAEDMLDGETAYMGEVNYPLPDAIKTSLSSVKAVTAMQYDGSRQLSVYEEGSGNLVRQFQEDEGFVYADSAFFNVFDFARADFQWIAGNPQTALTEPLSLVLTESMANKYFPNEDALGKTIKINNREDYTVTGVVSDFPPNTDFPFRMLASYETLKLRFKDFLGDWRSLGPNQCYVVLQDGATAAEVEKQILEVHNAHLEQKRESLVYTLQPIQEVHTDTRYGNFRNRTVSWETMGALLIIGLFLIITAVINFVNLTTAQAIIRTKEVCVRKVMGSSKRQLVKQFLGETFIITLISGILALGAAELVMLTQAEVLLVTLENTLIADPAVLLMLLGMVLVVTLLAGMYPSLVMSRFNPVAAIRNKGTFGLNKGARLRWGLVTLQLVISQVFIIGTIVVIRQMEFFRSADLGFEQEAIVVVTLPENQEHTLQTLKNQWAAIPQVQDISLAFTTPAGEGRYGNWQDIRWKGAPEEEGGIIFEYQGIDEHYLDLYQIPLLAGRNFVPSDTMKSVILNQHLAKRAGFAEPADAVGETMLIGDKAYTVVGVTEDFHTRSLRDELDYVAFVMNPKRYYHASIKLDMRQDQAAASAKLPETLAQIEKIWSATYPAYVFEYEFLDESIAAYYREEARLSRLFKILAGITIFIGCLGLYGLVAFMAVRRTKEVGVRKVLGASVRHILVLFSKEFTTLVLIAFCIAGPVAYYFMQQWLNNFTYQIDLSIGVFLLAIGSSILIALLTVSYQSIKAALANPIDSLRNE
uniref:ABC transporter permease n=1 Tax=Roseihalotalea indica TaxID=2867963 RepID=A0AA49GQQ7_9BACT|nr:ABC transporter permease [Tunicatimonas sp. TK19036]